MSLISIYQSASPSAGSPSVMEFYFASPVVTDGDYSIDGVDLPNYESAFSGSSGWTLTSGQPSASPMIITSVADGVSQLTQHFIPGAGYYSFDGDSPTNVTYTPGSEASVQQYQITITGLGGTWLLYDTSNANPIPIAWNADPTDVLAAFIAQGWSVASVTVSGGGTSLEGSGVPPLVYVINWNTGESSSAPQVAGWGLSSAGVTVGSYGPQMDPTYQLVTDQGYLTSNWASGLGLPSETQVANMATTVEGQVAVLQNSSMLALSLPPAIQIPASGSVTYPITIYLRNAQGGMGNAASTPTVSVVDPLGNSYASRLSTIAHPSTGKYTLTVTINASDTETLLSWEVSAVTDGGTQVVGGQSWVSQPVQAYFTSTDRSTLASAASSASSAATSAAAAQSEATSAASSASAAASGVTSLQSQVSTIQNNTTISLSLPPAIQIPSSGSMVYPIAIYLRDLQGVMTNATSTPTITVVDPLGNSYGSRLSSIANPSTGKYTLTATINSTDTEVLLIWEVTAVMSEGTQIVGGQSWVTQEVMAYFTTSDRTNLTNAASSAATAASEATAAATGIAAAATQTTALAIKAQTDLIGTNAADSPNAVTAQGNASSAATSAVVVGRGSQHAADAGRHDLADRRGG